MKPFDLINSITYKKNIVMDSKAEEVYNKAKEVSIRWNNKFAQVTSLNGLSMVQNFRGKIDDALVLITEATAIAKELGDKGQIIKCLNKNDILNDIQFIDNDIIKNSLKILPAIQPYE